jgi:hypothetical protein
VEALAHPSTLEGLRTRESTPTPSPFVVFTFGLAVNPLKSLWEKNDKKLKAQLF